MIFINFDKSGFELKFSLDFPNPYQCVCVTNKNVHGVHDCVSFGDQSPNAEKVITPHTRHQSLILVCISYQQMGNTFAQ